MAVVVVLLQTLLSMKPIFPSSAIFTGKVPVLMVDNTPLPQSLAIARYAAKLTGLVPEDNFDAALCDAMADTLSDISGEGYKLW